METQLIKDCEYSETSSWSLVCVESNWPGSQM